VDPEQHPHAPPRLIHVGRPGHPDPDAPPALVAILATAIPATAAVIDADGHSFGHFYPELNLDAFTDAQLHPERDT